MWPISLPPELKQITMKKSAFINRSELAGTLWVFRKEFLVVGILSFLSNLLMLAPTIYMLQVFDRVMVSRSELTLLAVSLITLFLFGVMACSEWLRSRVLVRAGMQFDELLSTRVFNASFEARLGESSAPPSRAFGDLMQIRQFMTGNGIFAIFDAPWAPIYIAVTFLLHPWLGALALVFAVIQAALAWFGHRHTVAPAEEASKSAGETTVYLQSKLRNAEVLESMGMISNLRNRWNIRHEVATYKSTSAHALTNRITSWSKFIRYTQQSLSLGAGALLVIDGQLSPGAMIAANVLMGRALAPIDQLVSTWKGFATCKSAFARLDALLAEHPDRDLALKRMPPTGAIELRNVVATAGERVSPILKGISLTVPAGTVLAVLGPSGSGKSTLARVMVGIWPGVTGDVHLDGLPINSWNRTDLGPHLGYLPQDVELFDGSIAENIARLGEVNSNKVIEAARASGMHEMILRFPKGYDTPIGEAGGLLSGGQRQRIGLARAIYGDPALIVLDEPNANLDDAGEAALLNTIRALKAKGKTVILITHRPGAVAVADRLVVLQDGKIMIEGPKDRVLAALRPTPSQTSRRPPPAFEASPQVA